MHPSFGRGVSLSVVFLSCTQTRGHLYQKAVASVVVANGFHISATLACATGF